ncbi:MAG: PD-(D/E)XK nuclease family transposase [Muribaculaceae bacterium]|nr:PD-(D/E)XK nuclease family transposase [Muribaculaceae bacterium]
MEVFLCNFHVPGLETKDLTKARMLDEETGKPVGTLIRLVFIQFPMFEKVEDECESEYEQWIYNLKNMGQCQRVAFQGRNEIFKRLASISNVASLTPEERRSYEADVKNARDYYNQMEFARSEGLAKGFAEGRSEGLAKGRAEGLAEGRAEGRAEGLAEGRAEGRAEGEMMALEKTALKMKSQGFTDEQIRNITGLDVGMLDKEQ